MQMIVVASSHTDAFIGSCELFSTLLSTSSSVFCYTQTLIIFTEATKDTKNHFPSICQAEKQ